jgi:hypothetical protein
MPDAVLTQIADAVAAGLNDASLSQSFTATREYLPEIELADGATDLSVVVVPGRLASEWATRAASRTEHGVDIGIRKKLAADESNDNATLDPLVRLVEEITDLVKGARPDDYPTAICTRVENDPIYSRQHLRELRQFTAILRLTYELIG